MFYYILRSEGGGMEPSVKFLGYVPEVCNMDATRAYGPRNQIDYPCFYFFRMYCVRFRSGSIRPCFDRDSVDHSSGAIPGDHRETGVGVLETNTSRCDESKYDL